MSSSARLLRFPNRARHIVLSPEETNAAARAYLSIALSEKTAQLRNENLSNADILSSICRSLRDLRDVTPAEVGAEATDIYRWLNSPGCRVGLFDEHDYFLGETALLAGAVYRQLGRREDAFRWLDRAEAGFRHTVNPAPGMASVAYARLALRFEMGRYEDVIDLTPSLASSFEKLSMALEASKCSLLLAMSLKQCGRRALALEVLEPVADLPVVRQDLALRARVLSELGDIQQLEGRNSEALAAFRKALEALGDSGLSVARADLRMFVGAAYSGNGNYQLALGALRSALIDYRELGMATRAAYVNVFMAETLLALDRPREAEWEILQALPTIEEQKMVPEGFAAVALLRESVKRRKADPNALRELREHLQKRN
jgi:tetratricopeptide (TPR) repeat protein